MLSEFLSPAAGIIYYYLRKPRHGHLSPYVCVCVCMCEVLGVKRFLELSVSC